MSETQRGRPGYGVLQDRDGTRTYYAVITEPTATHDSRRVLWYCHHGHPTPEQAKQCAGSRFRSRRKVGATTAASEEE